MQGIVVVHKVDFELVFSMDEFRREFLDSEEEDEEFEALEKRAREFLTSYTWCPPIQATFVAAYFAPIVAVFAYKVEKSRPIGTDSTDVLEWIWVVVGDLPSAYLVNEEITDALVALAGYTVVASDWVKAVEAGGSADDLVYFDAPPDSEYAALLRPRIEFLKQTFLYAEVPPLFPDIDLYDY